MDLDGSELIGMALDEICGRLGAAKHSQFTLFSREIPIALPEPSPAATVACGKPLSLSLSLSLSRYTPPPPQAWSGLRRRGAGLRCAGGVDGDPLLGSLGPPKGEQNDFRLGAAFDATYRI